MSYLYGIRFKCPENELIRSLRRELYNEPYDEIYWPDQVNNVSPADLYIPTSKVMDFLNSVCRLYEWMPHSYIRSYALEATLAQIKMEDENTDYLDIGPVNKVMNMVQLLLTLVDLLDCKRR
jgi:lanosterol synthase